MDGFQKKKEMVGGGGGGGGWSMTEGWRQCTGRAAASEKKNKNKIRGALLDVKGALKIASASFYLLRRDDLPPFGSCRRTLTASGAHFNGLRGCGPRAHFG